MHQFKFHRLPESFSILEYIEMKNKRLTRQSTLANCTIFITNYTAALPLHKFPRIWNELDPSLHNIPYTVSFKKQLLLYFLANMPLSFVVKILDASNVIICEILFNFVFLI